ncbi:SSS sodium solute transporter superfamily [Leadbetterella byssophila DSM 17132]|uniref:SSS sodium solute transporter superfamily n=1 Tax=Leadbetterella byssophila (strain DSM 17132 / JCM 16389 / KACC 11308 / NBRC 106382 / 4M15) TaxID=649349 RepID=E4RRI3_LEAB4|nr:solute:sodium symporter family transporter [Leadbetterella byssophila]ADQ15812.1 SSS sodium solute transporter superfamily [Leadbetterella byssophila DSM 17132]
MNTLTIITFVGFTLLTGAYAYFKTRKENLETQEGYFLGGRSLTGIVIAASMIMTNISTEHLVGMNGSAYKNGFIIVAWEVTSALALIVAAVYFVPRYLRMGLTTIPEYLEKRFDTVTRSMISLFLLVSFAVTLLPIVLYTGAINIESIFDISEVLQISKETGLWMTIVIVGVIGSLYAVFGGLKAVSFSDVIYGYGLFLGGLMIPVLALWHIGDGNMLTGFVKVFENSPEKFSVIGSEDSVMPFSTLFTGLIINQLYFWCMNQTIVQRVLGAKNLEEAQKGLLFTGLAKILIPFVIVLPGVIAFYYFGEQYYEEQDSVYPALVKKVMPVAFLGFFAAVIMGAVLSTFNAVLNSASTIFSIDVYKRMIDVNASDKKLVVMGKLTAAILAITSIIAAPFVANAPEGLFQLLQQLNGIFFIPIASIILAGFFFPQISAAGAKVSLLTGFLFYVTCIYIYPVDIHFIHLWGIEFLLNLAVMFAVSKFYPQPVMELQPSREVVELKAWKYTKPFAIFLVIITIGIYIFLGNI